MARRTKSKRDCLKASMRSSTSTLTSKKRREPTEHSNARSTSSPHARSSVRLQVPLQPGAGHWNRTSDLRFTKFRESNLRQPKPQETTKSDAPDTGLDGAKLSCPGSSVVERTNL